MNVGARTSQYTELLQQMLRQLSQHNGIVLPPLAVNSAASSVVNTTVSSPLTVASTGGPSLISRLAPLNVPSSQNRSSWDTNDRDAAPIGVEYYYRVKLINSNKKSDFIVRQLNNFTSKFRSIQEARGKFKEQFGDQVSSLPDFSLGYLDGSQQAKVWLYTTEDLTAMYRKYPKGGAINLWCEGNYDLADGGGNKRKRGDAAEQSSHRKAKEDENESIFKDLHEKHSGKYDTPRLRLWSRMIAAGIHDDYDEPPDIPAFSKSKRARKETVMDSISGAAVAIVEALQDKGKTTGTSAAPVSTGMSPGKCIDLRMKNFEQLRYLQSLLDDGILSEAQYAEQKRSILDILNKLK